MYCQCQCMKGIFSLLAQIGFLYFHVARNGARFTVAAGNGCQVSMATQVNRRLDILARVTQTDAHTSQGLYVWGLTQLVSHWHGNWGLPGLMFEQVLCFVRHSCQLLPLLVCRWLFKAWKTQTRNLRKAVFSYTKYTFLIVVGTHLHSLAGFLGLSSLTHACTRMRLAAHSM